MSYLDLSHSDPSMEGPASSANPHGHASENLFVMLERVSFTLFYKEQFWGAKENLCWKASVTAWLEDWV